MVNVVINLDSQHGGVCYAGKTMSGTIEIHLPQPAKFRGVSFIVYGRAKCEWTQRESRTVGHGDNRRTETHNVQYEGKNVYISNKMLLFGSPHGDPIELPSGTHKYNFQFPLPALIPASFEGTYGNIRYRVEAELDVPWGLDKGFKLQFIVAREDELNSQPELKIPIQLEEVKKFCCWCCESDPLLMTVTLPFGGFVPGQDIPIKVSYVNESDVNIEQTRFSLKRIINYNSSSPSRETKTESDKIIERFEGGVMKLQNKNVETVLSLPSVLPNSNGMLCDVIQILYELKIEAWVEGCHGNVSLITPIVIGSNPLVMDSASVQPTFGGELMQPPIDFQPVLPYTNENYQHVPAMASYDPPPTFDEAVALNVVPGANIGNIQPGWNIPSEHMPMPMPMPSGPPMMPPYPVPVSQFQPSVPSAPSEEKK